MRRTFLVILVVLTVIFAGTSESARLKDVASFRGIRTNQLIGYGLVVGLGGTGDDQQVYFTLRSVQLMLRRLGVKAADDLRFNLRNLRVRNVAAVMVTATLPPFARSGMRLDVTVSSLGNATSLRGGTLLLTPLRGVDLEVYALAQGPVSIGGSFRVAGRTGSRLNRNQTTAGRIPLGAIVEREVTSEYVSENALVVSLRKPDFTTANRLATAINTMLGGDAASSKDPATVTVTVPDEFKEEPVELMAKLEGVEVDPDAPAQVIINERTGTVVVGRRVKLSPVAISHGALTLEISERFAVSQPSAPLIGRAGQTAVVPQTDVKATEKNQPVKLLKESASISDVVSALNALGASPRDLIAIFQALEQAGALSAKLVVQ